MAYHEEEKTALRIQNYVLWSGDSPVRGCADLFNIEKIEMRELRAEWRSSCNMEAMGQEAALTGQVLGDMVPQLRRALFTFHTSSLTFEMQAVEIVRVSKSTYHSRLIQGHAEFDLLYLTKQSESRERSASYARAARMSR